jgi:excisionase family DNA binding protein
MEKGEKRWMIAGEVADYLSVHRVTVYRVLYAHGLPGVKLKGLGWRIDRKKLDNWMEGEMEERERRWRRIIDWRLSPEGKG